MENNNEKLFFINFDHEILLEIRDKIAVDYSHLVKNWMEFSTIIRLDHSDHELIKMRWNVHYKSLAFFNSDIGECVSIPINHVLLTDYIKENEPNKNLELIQRNIKIASDEAYVTFKALRDSGFKRKEALKIIIEMGLDKSYALCNFSQEKQSL